VASVTALRLLVACGLCLWVGATMLLSSVAWFSRRSLVERLRPYSGSSTSAVRRSDAFSVASLREVIGPLAAGLGNRLARVAGITEDLGLRLQRLHSPLDPTAFRLRELGFSALAFATGAAVAFVVPSAAVGLFVLVGLPALTFLLLEQRLASASAAWQRRLFLELPVVAEQLAKLLGAGYSLGSALGRLATRAHGACGADLRRVVARIRQGLSESAALEEWAGVARVEALDRLVAILALHAEASDLGRLVSDEARAIRREVQRRLVAAMERRGEQVWIPVTIAALVPGTIFLAVPFVEALRVFASG
jgi:tight adherence protein C